LGQEMRATALRVEKFVNGTSKRLADRMSDVVQAAAPKLELEAYQTRSFETPEFSETLPNYRAEEYASTLNLFKSAKDFFEKNGKQAMQEGLEKQLQEPVAGYLEVASGLLKQVYVEAFVATVDALKAQSNGQVDEYFAGLLEALSAKVDVGKLTTVRDQLQGLMA
ncbi:MAG: dynamin family protein, partial [Tumebacillaceae bacterium]